MDTTKIKIDADQDHILFTVGLYKLFLALGKEGMDALSVYIHLFFTARIQATNTVWANNSYLQKGTACGEAKIKKAKTLLKSLGLIEYIRDKPKKGTPILGKVYIKLNIIPNRETMEKILSSTGSISTLVDDNTSCTEVLKYLNIKSKDSINTISLSDSKESLKANDNFESKKDIPKIKDKILNINKDTKEIIEYWNTIKLVSKHKTDTKTKTIMNAIKSYTELKSGKFCYNNDITQEHLKKMNVPETALHHKFTHEEIITGLHNYSLQFEKGYWPVTEAEKLKLPRSLSSCFLNKYNPNCISPFLKVFYNKPKKLADTATSLPEIKDPGYNIIREVLQSMSGESIDTSTLYKNTLKIREWIADIRDDFKYLPKQGNDDFYSRFTSDPKSVNLFRDLEDFLMQRKSGNVIADVNMVKPGTKTWKNFEVYLFQNFCVDVNNPPKKPREQKPKVYVTELQYPWDEDTLTPDPNTWMYKNLPEDVKKKFKESVLEHKFTTQEELEKVIEIVVRPILYTKEQIEESDKRVKRISRVSCLSERVV